MLYHLCIFTVGLRSDPNSSKLMGNYLIRYTQKSNPQRRPILSWTDPYPDRLQGMEQKFKEWVRDLSSMAVYDGTRFSEQTILEESLQKYLQLPKKGKPIAGEEWTPLATVLVGLPKGT